MTEPVEELSKEEIQELIQAFQADPMSITKSENDITNKILKVLDK